MNSKTFIAAILVTSASIVALTPSDAFAICGGSAAFAALIGIQITRNSAMNRRIFVGALGGALIGWVSPYVIMWAVIAYVSVTGEDLMPVPN